MASTSLSLVVLDMVTFHHQVSIVGVFTGPWTERTTACIAAGPSGNLSGKVMPPSVVMFWPLPSPKIATGLLARLVRQTCGVDNVSSYPEDRSTLAVFLPCFLAEAQHPP